MGSEESRATGKISRAPLSQLIQEREQRGWTQSEVAKKIGTTQVNVSRWEQGITFPSAYNRQKLGTLFGKTLSELGLVPQEQEEGESNESWTHAPQPQTSAIWNLPYRRNPFFTGREEILAHLHAILTDKKTAALTQAKAISGLGGIGKTQIAVEYAYRYCHHYSAILWITAATHEMLTSDFVALAPVLDLPEQHEQDQEIILRAVKRWLATHSDYLLIVDNVDDLKLVSGFLPTRGEGKVLLTTRLQALGSLAQSIEVEKMGKQEGLLFLLRRTKILAPDASLDQLTKEEQDQAATIVDALDGLPLALDQAGAFIEGTRCSFQEYLHLYATRRKQLLEKRSAGTPPIDHPESVTATWSLSFQQIEEVNPAAADVLRLFAFLDAEAIPEEIIIEGAAEAGPILEPIADDPLKRNDAIATLLRYSLIRRNTEARLLSIHRLVQAVLRDSMEKELQRLWAERAIHATNRAFPDIIEVATWEQCRRCLPHVQISLVYLDEYDLAFPEAAHLLNKAANYLAAHAQYAQTEALLKKALAIRKRVLEPTHPDIAVTLNDLGMFYLTNGTYTQARELLWQALVIREQAFGVDHADTATSLHNLAALYYAEGNYPLAEDRYLQALRIRRSVLPPDHLDHAQSLSSLAELYTVQGKYTQAEEFYREALRIQEQTLGPNNLTMAKTLNNLALLYRSKCEYRRAEEFYQQALHIQEPVLGMEHPDIAQTLNNLARLYRAQGEYVKAAPFYDKALAIRENVFGPDHPSVAESFYCLAKLYQSQAKYSQAEKLYQQALNIQERRLGEDHPIVASTLNMLARIYHIQGKYSLAEELYLRALRIREKTSWSDHPYIALIINNLGEIYQTQGNYPKARKLFQRSREIRERSLGKNHPYVAFSLSNLAENSFLQKDYKQAEALYQEALAIREQQLGTSHPRTAATYHNLGRLYSALERHNEAESFYQKALSIHKQKLGSEHPDVAATLEQYALLLRKITGRETQARQYEEQARVIRAKHRSSQGLEQSD